MPVVPCRARSCARTRPGGVRRPDVGPRRSVHGVRALTTAGAWTSLGWTQKGDQVSSTAQAASYVAVQTQTLSASNGVDYAYRATGVSGAIALVGLQHFRGNLDNWDPALIDALGQARPVITFDNRGVAASSGRTPNTVAQM